MLPDMAANVIVNAIKRSKAFPPVARPDRASLRRNARNKQASGLVFLSNSLTTIFAGTQHGIGQK
jgi:hypothetical protein